MEFRSQHEKERSSFGDVFVKFDGLVRDLYNGYGKPKPDCPYRIDKALELYPLGEYTRPSDGRVFKYNSYGWIGCRPDPPRNEEWLKSKAYSNFYSKLDQVDLETLVTIAELPKAIKMIAERAQDLTCAYKNVKKGRIGAALECVVSNSSPKRRAKAEKVGKKAWARTKDASSTFLEMKYGWNPAIYDVYSAMEALDKSWSDEPADVKIKTGSVRTEPLKWTRLGVEKYGHVYSSTGNAKEIYTVTGFVRVTDPELRRLASLGLLNPALVAWELIPFSFVWDWFNPIGNWLHSLTADVGTTWIRGSEGYMRKLKGTHHVTKAWGKYPCDFRGSVDNVFFQRKPLTGFPSSSQILSVKPLGDLVNADKAITSLALLRSTLFS
jgi:hypothetical protein